MSRETTRKFQEELEKLIDSYRDADFTVSEIIGTLELTKFDLCTEQTLERTDDD